MFAASKTAAVASAANYIEDVFSTYLYTGNGSTQTITNGIDLSGKGGLTWIKSRNNTYEHRLFDTARGATFFLRSDATNAEAQFTNSLTSFNSNGFSLGSNVSVNASSTTYASWTFRKQAKFFDVVTYTGNAASNQTINHNLGSAPGFIIVKATNSTSFWYCYHRSLGATKAMSLNTTDAESTLTNYWFNTAPTATQFTVGTVNNDAGVTYVAYLFAHDAGGFGATGSDNVITCGSFTTSGTSPNNATVNLGYEPQFVLYKLSSSTGDWRIVDNMRGFLASGGTNTAVQLRPNLSNAEQNTNFIQLNSTGFTSDTGVNAQTYIYIAIRRGPMRTPTTGTSVFVPVAYTNTAVGTHTLTTNFPVDLNINQLRNTAGSNNFVADRLRGGTTTSYRQLITSSTNAEATGASNGFGFDSNTTILENWWGNNGFTAINWSFRRAPGFMDVVCWTGTGSYPFTINHNLGVVPELMIFKSRSATDSWYLYLQPLVSPNANWYKNYLVFNTNASLSDTTSFTTSPTNTTIPVASFYSGSGVTWVAYLFATLPGVSKVGSYTGTGTTKQIDCGFAAGARFVLIKRTDSTGDWYVWDSARGIVAGNDPYLLLNSTAAEVTNTDYVDTYSAGFEISSTAPSAINANGGTFIFLAIA